jgi:bacteriorhodopsin
MAPSLGQALVAISIAVLVVPVALYADSGENDWIVVTLVGEPTLLALYLARSRRPASSSTRLLLSGTLLIPLVAVLMFFAVMLLVLLTQGPEAFN